jgi:hypothetical protein
MPHPLVLALFDNHGAAANAARALRASGVPRERVSIVMRSHEEEGALAEATGASPGSEIEDSSVAARLGELGGHLLAAIALVMPGIGPIVADGPLAAGLAEAAGHAAGGIARALRMAGIPDAAAQNWQQRIERGDVLVGVHVAAADVSEVRAAMQNAGAVEIVEGTWRS